MAAAAAAGDAIIDESRASDATVGLALAVSSSLFIGASFIVKKKGLRLAGASGLRAGARHAQTQPNVASASARV
jgi:hypothetical protein